MVDCDVMSIFRKQTDDSDRQSRLTNLETTIENARQHIIGAGHALAAIHSERLYLLAYSSFDDYVAQRWNMTKQHAHNLMSTAKVFEQLKHHPTPPTSINQAVALASLPEEQRAEVWDEVTQEHPRPTGDQVRKATAKRKPAKKKRTDLPKPRRIRVPGATVVIERNKRGAEFSAEQILRDALAKVTGDTTRLDQREAA